MTLADGSNTSALSSSSRTSHSSSTSRVESTAVKNEERDVPSAVSSRLPASTAISVVSSRTDGSSPHSLSPSSSSPSSSSSTSSSIAASTSHMKRTSSGLHASAAHQRTSPKTNRGSGSSSSNSSLLVDLLQKESGKTERDSSPPEKKRRKYSSQGGAAHSDVESYPSVTKVANAMMAGHHSANGPTILSGSEKLFPHLPVWPTQARTGYKFYSI